MTVKCLSSLGSSLRVSCSGWRLVLMQATTWSPSTVRGSYGLVSGHKTSSSTSRRSNSFAYGTSKHKFQRNSERKHHYTHACEVFVLSVCLGGQSHRRFVEFRLNKASTVVNSN